jgi:GNAT superfamily N-acetyltransferase
MRICINNDWTTCPIRNMVLKGIFISKIEGVLTAEYSPGILPIVYVTDDDNNPIAFVIYFYDHTVEEFWIEFGFCDPEYRNQGYYKVCMDWVKMLARGEGFKRIHTCIRDDNHRMNNINKTRKALVPIGYLYSFSSED